MTIEELKKKREERSLNLADAKKKLDDVVKKNEAERRAMTDRHVKAQDEAWKNLMATEGALMQLDELIAEDEQAAKAEENPEAQVIPFPEGEEAK